VITGIRRAWPSPVQREASLAGDFLQAPIASDQIFLLDVNVALFLTSMFIETSASIIVLAPILGTRSLPFSAGIAPATFATGRNGLAGKHSAVLLASHRPVVSGTTRETASALPARLVNTKGSQCQSLPPI